MFKFNSTLRHVVDLHEPDLMCLFNILSQFSPLMLQHQFLWKVYSTKFSRLMLLGSLYLWPSVQITAIRLFTCELKRFERKRSAFIVWPCAPKEDDSAEFKGVILQGYSELWAVNNLMCTRRVLTAFLANMWTYLVCSIAILFVALNATVYIVVIYVLINIFREMSLLQGLCPVNKI